MPVVSEVIVRGQVNTSFIKIFVLLSDWSGRGGAATVRAVFQPPAESLLSLTR